MAGRRIMKTLIDYFERQADEQHEHIGLICSDELLTYREMDLRANQQAHLLRSMGIQAGCLVGLLLERSSDLYITILAVLKTGAAYVPLDPEYPSERILSILTD